MKKFWIYLKSLKFDDWLNWIMVVAGLIVAGYITKALPVEFKMMLWGAISLIVIGTCHVVIKDRELKKKVFRVLRVLILFVAAYIVYLLVVDIF